MAVRAGTGAVATMGSMARGTVKITAQREIVSNIPVGQTTVTHFVVEVALVCLEHTADEGPRSANSVGFP
jgi:hypothetical protein